MGNKSLYFCAVSAISSLHSSARNVCPANNAYALSRRYGSHMPACMHEEALSIALQKLSVSTSRVAATSKKSAHMKSILWATPYTFALCLASSRRCGHSSTAMTLSQVSANWMALPPTPAKASTMTEHLHHTYSVIARLHLLCTGQVVPTVWRPGCTYSVAARFAVKAIQASCFTGSIAPP